MKLKGVIHKMKYFTIALMLIAIISTPAISDLSQDDLNKIRLLIADELKPIQTEIQTVKTEIQTVKTELKDAIASVKEDVASLSGRVDGVEKLITWLMVIIVAIVGIPQVVVLWRSKKDRILEKQVETLTQKIEALEKQRIQSP
jgi:phage-related minor tail protein